MTTAPDDNVVLLPNAMAVNKHLYDLFTPAFVKDFPDAWIEIAYSHPSSGAVNAAETFSAFDLKGASDFAVAKNRAGLNVYVGPALRQGTPGRGSRATDANYLASRYAWVDVDADYNRTIGILRVRGLRPAMIIRTGSIPEPRLQIYFQLAEAVSSLQLRTLNAALHVLLPGSDPVVSPTHVMRLNGTVNYPTAGKTARGRMPEVVGADLATEDLWRGAGPYTERQLLEGAGVSTVPEASGEALEKATGDPWLDFAAAASSRRGRDDDALLALLETSKVPRHWHNSIRDAIATMVGRGWEEAAIRLACAPYCIAGAADRDLTPLIDGAFAKFGKGAPPEEEDGHEPPSAEGGFVPNPGQAAPKVATPDLYECRHHDNSRDFVVRTWLVERFLPETGVGLFSGQWGTGKSYAVLDLAASVMTGTPFAGHPIARRGGVLFIAAEAASEMEPRLRALVEHKLKPQANTPEKAAAMGNLDALPFSWIEQAPNMQNPKDVKKLIATAKAEAEGFFMAQYGLPLALIIVDTMSATGNFKDANDAAEAQRVMGEAAEISRQTGALVLEVDHFGKDIDTGTRGSSVKEGSADAIVALTGVRGTGGALTNTRMALRKSRGSRTGVETPFDLVEVQVDAFGETACIVEWKESQSAEQAAAGPRKGWWSKPLRVFRAALETALAEHSVSFAPYGAGGRFEKAVTGNFVKDEFMASYSVEGRVPGKEKKADAKRKAYGRALEEAQDLRLIGFRETSDEPYLWLLDREDK